VYIVTNKRKQNKILSCFLHVNTNSGQTTFRSLIWPLICLRAHLWSKLSGAPWTAFY